MVTKVASGRRHVATRIGNAPVGAAIGDAMTCTAQGGGDKLRDGGGIPGVLRGCRANTTDCRRQEQRRKCAEDGVARAKPHKLLYRITHLDPKHEPADVPVCGSARQRYCAVSFSCWMRANELKWTSRLPPGTICSSTGLSGRSPVASASRAMAPSIRPAAPRSRR